MTRTVGIRADGAAAEATGEAAAEAKVEVEAGTEVADISKLHPNWCVAASRREAKFTFGDKYVASVFKGEPRAPSIAHPMCSPNPMVTI